MSRPSFITQCWPDVAVDSSGAPVEPAPRMSAKPAPRTKHKTAFEILARVVHEADPGLSLTGVPYLVLNPAGAVAARGKTDLYGMIDVGVPTGGDHEIRVANVRGAPAAQGGGAQGTAIDISPYIPAQRTPVSDTDLVAAMQLLWHGILPGSPRLDTVRLLLAHNQLETSAGRVNCFCYNVGNHKAGPGWAGAVTYYQGAENLPHEVFFDFSPGPLNRWRAYTDLRSGVRDYMRELSYRRTALKYALAEEADIPTYTSEGQAMLVAWHQWVDDENFRIAEENKTISAYNRDHPKSPKKLKSPMTKGEPRSFSRAVLYALALWKGKYFTASPLGYANSLDRIVREKAGLSLHASPTWPDVPVLTFAGCDPGQSLPPAPAGIRPSAPLPPPAPLVDPVQGEHGLCQLKPNCMMVYAKHMSIEVAGPEGRVTRRNWTDADPTAPPLTSSGPLRILKVGSTPTSGDPAAVKPTEIRFPKPEPAPVRVTLQSADGRPLDGIELALQSSVGEALRARTDSAGRVNFRVPSGDYAVSLTEAPAVRAAPTLAGAPFTSEEVGPGAVRGRRSEALNRLISELLTYKNGNPTPGHSGGR